MKEKIVEFKLHIILVVSLLCLVSVIYGIPHQATSTTGEKYVIVVKPGMGASSIGHLHYEQGAIKSVLLFQVI